MEIQRLDPHGTVSRCVVHNHVAYFTGHSAKPGYQTLREQTAAVLKRYEEIFEEFHFKRENIFMVNIYLSDISMADEFEEVWQPWIGTATPPAGVCVQAQLAGENNLLELALMVAVD